MNKKINEEYVFKVFDNISTSDKLKENLLNRCTRKKYRRQTILISLAESMVVIIFFITVVLIMNHPETQNIESDLNSATGNAISITSGSTTSNSITDTSSSTASSSITNTAPSTASSSITNTAPSTASSSITNTSSSTASATTPIKNDYKYGNTPGNICNEGIVVYDSGWIYYRNDDSYLYKMRSDGTEKTKINDTENGTFFNIVGEWIYFKKYNNKGIYKVKTDGTNGMYIYENIIDYVFASEDWIYYSGKTDMTYGEGGDTYKLYKIRTNGMDNTLITDEWISPEINVVDNWIYYKINGGALMKIQIDGTKKTEIIDKKDIAHFVVSNNVIYFDNLNYNNGDSTYENLYRINTDGSNLKTIFTGTDKCTMSSINIQGEWVYYERNNLLYKIPINGGTPIKLFEAEKEITWLNIAQNKIFFTIVGDWRLYNMTTDGKNMSLTG